MNKARDGGAPPFYVARAKGHADVVRLLKEAGCDMNKAMDDGATPFHMAPRQCEVDHIPELLPRTKAAHLDNYCVETTDPVFHEPYSQGARVDPPCEVDHIPGGSVIQEPTVVPWDLKSEPAFGAKFEHHGRQ
jgi:hypothetical protein